MRRFKKNSLKYNERVVVRRKTTVPSKIAHKKIESDYEEIGGFLKVKKIYGDKFIKYYKIHTDIKERLSPSRIRKAINWFFREVRDGVIENTAGVFIKDLGYFYMQQAPTYKRGRRHKKATTFNFLGRPYRMSFVALRKDMKMGTWLIDNANVLHFCGKVRMKRVREKFYKNAFTALYSMYGSNLDIIYFLKNEHTESDSGSKNGAETI